MIDNSEFLVSLQVENDEPKIFSVCSDDDCGINLFNISWKYCSQQEK